MLDGKHKQINMFSLHYQRRIFFVSTLIQAISEFNLGCKVVIFGRGDRKNEFIAVVIKAFIYLCT